MESQQRGEDQTGHQQRRDFRNGHQLKLLGDLILPKVNTTKKDGDARGLQASAEA